MYAIYHYIFNCKLIINLELTLRYCLMTLLSKEEIIQGKIYCLIRTFHNIGQSLQ